MISKQKLSEVVQMVNSTTCNEDQPTKKDVNKLFKDIYNESNYLTDIDNVSTSKLATLYRWYHYTTFKPHQYSVIGDINSHYALIFKI